MIKNFLLQGSCHYSSFLAKAVKNGLQDKKKKYFARKEEVNGLSDQEQLSQKNKRVSRFEKKYLT